MSCTVLYQKDEESGMEGETKRVVEGDGRKEREGREIGREREGGMGGKGKGKGRGEGVTGREGGLEGENRKQREGGSKEPARMVIVPNNATVTRKAARTPLIVGKALTPP